MERNPLTAGLLERAQDWRWGSLWVREYGTPEQKALLREWPTPRPAAWALRVNAVTTKKEQSRWELSLSRSRPFGDDGWTAQTVKKLELEHTVRGEGGEQYKKERAK